MQELVKMIEKKIANEKKILDRTEGEVTVDWVETQAEIRHKTFCETFDAACSWILKSHGCAARQGNL